MEQCHQTRARNYAEGGQEWPHSKFPAGRATHSVSPSRSSSGDGIALRGSLATSSGRKPGRSTQAGGCSFGARRAKSLPRFRRGIEPILLFVKILARHVILRHFMSVHFLLVSIIGSFHSADRVSLERVPFF